MRKDVPIPPIKLNIQSAEIAEEDQFLFTKHDDETQEQLWQRKRCQKQPVNRQTNYRMFPYQNLALIIVHTFKCQSRKTIF